MTNNNKVGFNVDLFCKLHCTFWPPLKNSTKQLYLSPKYKGLGNAMNYLKDHVTYFNDWLGRNFTFYRINHFRKALVDNNYIKEHDRRRLQFNTNYSYDLITTIYG